MLANLLNVRLWGVCHAASKYTIIHVALYTCMCHNTSRLVWLRARWWVSSFPTLKLTQMRGAYRRVLECVKFVFGFNIKCDCKTTSSSDTLTHLMWCSTSEGYVLSRCSVLFKTYSQVLLQGTNTSGNVQKPFLYLIWLPFSQTPRMIEKKTQFVSILFQKII